MPFYQTGRLLKYITAMKLKKVKVHVMLSSPCALLRKTLNLMYIIHFSPKFTSCLQFGGLCFY